MGVANEILIESDFKRLRTLIYDEAGISLDSGKKSMLEARLRRRVQVLGLSSCTVYCDYVFSPNGKKEEMVHLIDAITTNKTDFFREPDHFQFMVATVLPELYASPGRRAFVWSAGCSSGEEPYTLAMVLSDFQQKNPGFQFKVLASDISTQVLEKAQTAIFKAELASPIPQPMLRKFFMRSKDRKADLVRIVPELRSTIEFRRVNFMDADLGVTETPDIIFCRNVIIYFDRETQIRVLKKLIGLLPIGGYFFSGHSESLQGMDLPLVPAGTAVYRKVDHASRPRSPSAQPASR